MRAAIYSPYKKQGIIEKLRKNGFLVTEQNPDIIFVYGGDGSILNSEKLFPGIPKVPLQRSKICSKCRTYNVSGLGELLEKISSGNFRIKEETKIEAVAGGKRLMALNEIQIRNEDLRKSLRFSLSCFPEKEIIGDGVVVATPYGSTAYYRSLGYAPFSKGIRIGFNNVWPKMAAITTDKCTIKVLREDAVIAADNFFVKRLRKGDTIVIRKSQRKARFVIVG